MIYFCYFINFYFFKKRKLRKSSTSSCYNATIDNSIISYRNNINKTTQQATTILRNSKKDKNSLKPQTKNIKVNDNNKRNELINNNDLNV